MRKAGRIACSKLALQQPFVDEVACDRAGNHNKKVLQVIEGIEPMRPLWRWPRPKVVWPSGNCPRHVGQPKGAKQSQYPQSNQQPLSSEQPNEGSEDRHIRKNDDNDVVATERKTFPLWISSQGEKKDYSGPSGSADHPSHGSFPGWREPGQNSEEQKKGEQSEQPRRHPWIIAQNVRSDRLNIEGEEEEQKAAFKGREDGFRFRPSLFQSPIESERQGSSHREEKEREDQIYPRDSRLRAYPFMLGRRNLGVIHPGRQGALTERKLARQQHREDRQATQRIERVGPARV